jgi:dolichyl-phosphate beta-glucosyltransferase
MTPTPTPPRLARSVVIPAYNEAARIGPYLEQVRAYCNRTFPDDYEVIVVDDGSTDGTAELLASIGGDWPRLRVLRHPGNRGKGAAVRTGMLAAEGDWLLMADADGATPIDQEARLADAIGGGADVAVGSRLLADPAVTRRRNPTRGLLGRLFAVLARWWLGISVRDTQCGFKMFRSAVARELFAACSESGYLFDLELLALAEQRGLRIAEVAIDWSEVPGGHLHVGRELGAILAALWRLRSRVR